MAERYIHLSPDDIKNAAAADRDTETAGLIYEPADKIVGAFLEGAYTHTDHIEPHLWIGPDRGGEKSVIVSTVDTARLDKYTR